MLNATEQTWLRSAHTGRPLPGNPTQCAGSGRTGAAVATGYVTIDVVNRCTPRTVSSSVNTPADPAYFADGGTGLASNANVLWGDVFQVSSARNTAESQTAVNIVADADFFGPGDYTFYGRYNGYDSRDNRRSPSSRTMPVRHARRRLFGREADASVVRRQIVVDAPIAQAFAVFTEQFGDFKPPEHNLLGAEIVEPYSNHGRNIYDRAGGRVVSATGPTSSHSNHRTVSCSAGTSARTGRSNPTRPHQRSRGPVRRRKPTAHPSNSNTATSNDTDKAGKASATVSPTTRDGRCTSPATRACLRKSAERRRPLRTVNSLLTCESLRYYLQFERK